MSGLTYRLVPASTELTAISDAAPRHGGIGFAIAGDQLSIAIADTDGRVMVATLHASALDDFCAEMADHLTEVSPNAADAQMGAAPWPSLQ